MQSVNALLHAIVDNILSVIVGKREAVELTVIALLAQGHVLIEDVPGVGKTSLASALARCVDSSFRRIQFTPDILPSDITGFSVFNQSSGKFEYKEGLVLSSFVLADEINRTSPKTQASLLEVMEERQVTVDGVSRRLSSPFMVLATQNPIDYVGTYPLPEAQMDRFLMRISMGYPDAREEAEILRRFRAGKPLAGLEPVAEAEDIARMQEIAGKIYLHESLYFYIVNLARATRRHPDVELGVSPRGSLALMRASQARALYNGRDYVLPDDVKLLAKPVLAHRLLMKQEARLRDSRPADVINELLKSIEIPQLNDYGS